MCEVARLKGIERGLRKSWRGYILRGTTALLIVLSVLWLAERFAGSEKMIVFVACWYCVRCAAKSFEMSKMIDSIWENQ